MASEPFGCPYCNALVTVPTGTAPGQRVPCPRCGEAIPYWPRDDSEIGDRGSAVGTRGPGTALIPDARPLIPDPRPPTPHARVRWPNWAVAGLVLGVMAVMAVVGLVWALKTVPDRRSRDRKEPAGYLPADVDVVALVHVARAMEDPAGREFLRPFGLGTGGGRLLNLDQWTGLRAEDIEQVAVGLKVKDHVFLPRLTLVVETRQPYELEKLLQKLETKRTIERGGKTLHAFTMAKVPAELWCPTDKLLVIGLEPGQLDAVPLSPQPGIDHFSERIQGLLRDQMGQRALALLVADTEQWDKRVTWLRLLPEKAVSKRDLKAWSQVEAVALWLRFEQVIQLSAAFRAADEPAARALQVYLVENQLAQPESIEIHKDVWVTLRSQTSGEAVSQALGRWIPNLPGAAK